MTAAQTSIITEGSSTWKCEADKHAGNLYYITLKERHEPPYKNQRHVNAILDIAPDGTLAGVELIDKMPPPPKGIVK